MANTTGAEALGLAVALFGLFFTVVLCWRIWLACRVVLIGVRLGRAKVGGPRFRFTFGMLAATFLLFPGWLALILRGVIASYLPPASYDPERMLLADLVGYGLIVGEIAFALGMGVIFWVWLIVARPVIKTSERMTHGRDYPRQSRSVPGTKDSTQSGTVRSGGSPDSGVPPGAQSPEAG